MKKTIYLDQFEEGMELAAPIKNKFGQVLLSAGVKLQRKHVNLFRTWGIESIEVNQEGLEEENVYADQSRIDEAKELLLRRVRWTPSSKEEHNLLNMGVEHILDNS